MSLAELQLYYSSPRLRKGLALRRFKKMALKAKKRTFIKMRRLKVKTIAATKRQYMLTTAYSDMKSAAKHNEDIVIMSVTSIAVLLFASVATAAQMLLNVFLTAFILSESITVNLLFIAAGTVAAIAVLYGWLSAFLLNLLSISIMDGAVKKTVRSVRLTFRKSLANASRVATAWLTLLSVIILPLIIVAAIGYAVIQLNTVSMSQLFTGLQFATIGAIIWIIYILLNYSLLTYVSLFESHSTLASKLKRSRQLVVRKGRMFILAWYLALALCLGGLYSLTEVLNDTLALNKWFAFAILALPLILVFNGLMVVFYRKRRLARRY